MVNAMPFEDFNYGMDMAAVDPASMNDALKDVMQELMTDPMRMTTWMSSLMMSEQAVAMNTMRRMQGEEIAPVSAMQGDKRFADPAWKTNPFLLGTVEQYLVRRQSALQVIDSSRLPEATRRKARFALTMMLDAIAPSNTPWMNPAVVKTAMESGGKSLVDGLQQFLDDVKNNGGYPKQVDSSPFTLGENMAATPGTVVFRNELIELIAYTPQTETVHERPLLCSPPWINKYYIMDLAPGRSFVEWAVKHGHQTFMISYRNPDETMRNFKMDDYLRLGLLTAIDEVLRITGAPDLNIAALCLGGTMSAIALSYLHTHGQAHKIASATFTNTLVDFSEPGDLGVFTDEKSVSQLEKTMNERGFLESSEMARTFDWMRANDLIWSYVVSNWYMGKKPPSFDILTWNGDSTRMPAAMHSQYLRSCYLNNEISKGTFTICDTPIDMSKVQTPLYVLGAEADHIAPWHTTYQTTQLTGGPAKYVLTNAGHIAGIVNPPGGGKAAHWTKSMVTKGESPELWRASAEKKPGSWWEDWAVWAADYGGDQRAPYAIPEGEAAPGRYVRNETGEPIGHPAQEVHV